MTTHHPSCPARHDAGARCTCPAGKAEARILRRLDPDYPLQVLGAAWCVVGVLLAVLAVLILAGILPAPAWAAGA